MGSLARSPFPSRLDSGPDEIRHELAIGETEQKSSLARAPRSTLDELVWVSRNCLSDAAFCDSAFRLDGIIIISLCPVSIVRFPGFGQIILQGRVWERG